jgi:hypothetical protein
MGISMDTYKPLIRVRALHAVLPTKFDDCDLLQLLLD